MQSNICIYYSQLRVFSPFSSRSGVTIVFLHFESFENFVSIKNWGEPVYLNPKTQKLLLGTSKKHPLDVLETCGSGQHLAKLGHQRASLLCLTGCLGNLTHIAYH